jgi:hypothetical protein
MRIKRFLEALNKEEYFKSILNSEFNSLYETKVKVPWTSSEILKVIALMKQITQKGVKFKLSIVLNPAKWNLTSPIQFTIITSDEEGSEVFARQRWHVNQSDVSRIDEEEFHQIEIEIEEDVRYSGGGAVADGIVGKKIIRITKLEDEWFLISF